MKQEILSLIEDFNEEYKNWDGDIIDLSDEHKDLLCYEWLLAYPSWMDDYLPVCISGIKSQIEFLDLLYAKGTDEASQLLKGAIYLELESALRERVADLFCEEHIEVEPFAGYGRGE